MFCPECRVEYREGFTECSDCRVSLVSELPPEPKKEYIEFVTVLSGDPSIIAMGKSILEPAEIQYLVQNDGVPYPAMPGEIQVAKYDEQQARELLKDL